MNPVRSLLGLAAASALACAACSSSSHATAPSSTAAAVPTTVAAAAPSSSPPTTSGASALASIGSAAANGDTVSLARGAQGIFLIAADGHSLYVFDKDQGTTSGCTGGCAAVWPALTASSVTTGPVVDKAEVATATGQAPDQLTYYGHLLYEFKGDSAPGQTNGIAIPGWHLLGPFGNVMLPRAAS